jgi:hypothetical protein
VQEPTKFKLVINLRWQKRLYAPSSLLARADEVIEWRGASFVARGRRGARMAASGSRKQRDTFIAMVRCLLEQPTKFELVINLRAVNAIAR